LGYKLTARHYGLIVNDTIFPPSNFALAVAGILSENNLEKLLEDDFEEFRTGVKKIHKTYNFIKKEAYKEGKGGRVFHSLVKSRDDGRKGNVNNYRAVRIENHTIEDALKEGIKIRCQCDDYIKSGFGLDTACYHSAVSLIALWMKNGDVTFLPYNYVDNMIIVEEILYKRYVKRRGYKLLTFDKKYYYSTLNEEIKKHNVKFGLLPQKEESTELVEKYKDYLIENLGFEKDVYLVEKFGGKEEIAINFIDGEVNVRILPERDPPQFLVSILDERDRNAVKKEYKDWYVMIDPLYKRQRRAKFAKGIIMLESILAKEGRRNDGKLQ